MLGVLLGILLVIAVACFIISLTTKNEFALLICGIVTACIGILACLGMIIIPKPNPTSSDPIQLIGSGKATIDTVYTIKNSDTVSVEYELKILDKLASQD